MTLHHLGIVVQIQVLHQTVFVRGNHPRGELLTSQHMLDRSGDLRGCWRTEPMRC
jgi:hypothetical protein